MGGVAQAQEVDPEWPCVQRLVPDVSSAVMWPLPVEEDMHSLWKQDAVIRPLAERLGDLPAYTEAEAEAVSKFAQSVPDEQKEAQLSLLAVGILDVTKDDGKLAAAKGLVEKPAPADAPSTLSIIGRYILDPAVMLELARQETGAGGEIQLTDAMARTIGKVPFHGLRFDGLRFDCGTKIGFLEANIAFALERADLSREMKQIVRRYAEAESAKG